MYMSTVLAVGLGAVAAQAQQYTLTNHYDGNNFFDAFDFFVGEDPTHGFVEYVNRDTAFAESLVGNMWGAAIMGVDTKTQWPAFGRKSVRLTSRDSFTHGLFIADIAHMPGSVCGAWPAFWMFGPDWPNSGEIDIIEGVNNANTNSYTLHSSGGCWIDNWGAAESTYLKNADCGAGNSFEGCGQASANTNTYGDGFNNIGGGVFATEWQSDHIAIWFFPRDGIPQDIVDGNPNPGNWGTPEARFNGGGGCNLDDHFHENNLVFDTTFCGDWAGAVWDSNPTCSALGSCVDFVAGNPDAFNDAFWVVNSIKVYQFF